MHPDRFDAPKSSFTRLMSQAMIAPPRQVSLYDFSMDIKHWVRAARAHRKWTLEQLGEAVSRSKATVGFWENGKTKPSYLQMRQISQCTGFPMPSITDAGIGGLELNDASPPSALAALCITNLGALLDRVDPSTRLMVASMLGKYAEEPSKWSAMPSAIELLLRRFDEPPSAAVSDTQ